MITNLPDELRQGPNEVRLMDVQTQAVYVVVNEETHRRAMKALKEQEDWESIQRGLADRANGREMPLAEADALMRKELGLLPRSSGRSSILMA